MKFAIWGEATANAEDVFTRGLDLACEAGITRILPCLYNTREAKFSSKTAQASTDLFERYLLPLAQERQLEVHAWVMMLRYGADDAQSKAHWFAHNRRGQSSLEYPQYVDYYTWLSPFVAEVQAYLHNLICEIAQLEVAGVQLDYIRYCDRFLAPGLLPLYNLKETTQLNPSFDYDYHPAALAAFEEKYQYNPLDVDIRDHRWQTFRLDAISAIVRNCGEIVRAQGKQLSAAVFPHPGNAPDMVLQDWGAWPLDAAYPMIYHKFYNRDYHWVAEEYKRCRQQSQAKKVIPGIFLPDFVPQELHDCLEELQDAAVTEVSLFELGALTPERAKVIKRFS